MQQKNKGGGIAAPDLEAPLLGFLSNIAESVQTYFAIQQSCTCGMSLKRTSGEKQITFVGPMLNHILSYVEPRCVCFSKT